MASTKTPLTFDESKNDYEQWKKDVSLWILLTDL